jgi:hypothetical protein
MGVTTMSLGSTEEGSSALTPAARVALDELLADRREAAVGKALHDAQGPRITATEMIRAYYDTSEDSALEASTEGWQRSAAAATRRAQLTQFTLVLTGVITTAFAILLTFLGTRVSTSGYAYTTVVYSLLAIGVVLILASTFAFYSSSLARLSPDRHNASANLLAMRETNSGSYTLFTTSASGKVFLRSESVTARGQFLDKWLEVESKLRDLNTILRGMEPDKKDETPIGVVLRQLQDQSAFPKDLSRQLFDMMKVRNSVVHGRETDRDLKEVIPELAELGRSLNAMVEHFN